MYDKKVNYYQEFYKTYLENENLLKQLSDKSQERNSFLEKILKMKIFFSEYCLSKKHNGRKKHNRRTANEIDRNCPCPYAKCEKFYGSEGSLNLHIKIKHRGGNKTDREKIAVSHPFR